MKIALTIMVCLILSFLMGVAICYWCYSSKSKWAVKFRHFCYKHIFAGSFIICLQIIITGLIFGAMLLALLPLK